jgi:hypothetical protein
MSVDEAITAGREAVGLEIATQPDAG